MAFEKLKKILRGIDRAMESESNKEIVSDPLLGPVAHLGLPIAPVVLTRDKAVNPTQLEFEKNHAIIEGDAKAVSLVRRFDNIAGRKMEEGKWDSIEAHRRDLKDVFARVSARTEDGAQVRALRYEDSRGQGITIPLGRPS